MTQRPIALVAMSGGVDSSVAAHLAKSAGYDVIGCTLRMFDPSILPENLRGGGREPSEDARAVADAIGIRHFVLDCRERFRDNVIDYFSGAYASGLTPNPCVMCNRRVKFGALFDEADRLGAAVVVSGHYARLDTDTSGARVLRRAHDRRKDQSYFLFNLRREFLDRLWFPLDGMEKPAVRAIAAEVGIPVAEKKDSQEVCFIRGEEYWQFLERNFPGRFGRAGDIVSADGRALGKHDGFHRFTIGQRRGLGVASTSRLFVTGIDPDTGRVVLDGRESLERARFQVTDVNWLTSPPTDSTRANIVVRYRATPVLGLISRDAAGDTWTVELDAPVPGGVTPGQAAVFYTEDTVLGGGFIKR